MEKSFDFGALLKNHEKKHKSKPSQFVSVAGGVQKRLEKNLKYRKSHRLSVFDSIRNLPRCDSPTPVSDTQLKIEHRRQQLEKWKEEKEKKKKEAAAHKKKPFVAGVPHVSHKFMPPPPKPMPSTSGRVTRSQSAKNTARTKAKESKLTVQSFAPKNASFRPPDLKNHTILTNLASTKAKKDKHTNVTFQPISHDFDEQYKTKKSTVTESKIGRKTSERNAKSKVNSTLPNTGRVTRKQVETSSSSDVEQNHSLGFSTRDKNKAITSFLNINNRISRKSMNNNNSQKSSEENTSQSSSDVSLTKKATRKSMPTSDTPIIKQKTQRMSLKNTTSSGSSSDEAGEKSSAKVRKSFAGANSPLIKKTSRKSLPNQQVTSESGTDEYQFNSSAEKHVYKKNTRRSFVKTSPILNRQTPRASLPQQNSQVKSHRTTRKSLQNEVETPKNKVPKSESSSEEKLRSPKSLTDGSMTPEQIIEEAKKCSPCVTMSRGKANARKEMKKKLAEGLLDDDASNMASVDDFRRQLASEIKRMTEMCETWDKISEQTVLPESIQEAVLGAVGQARLLMAQKLQQFASLVERCARPEPGVALVTPADLHGFWDMVFMQIENIDMRFKNLEDLRQRDWVEVKPVEVKKKVVVPKPEVKKSKPIAGPSRLREMIAAARKAKKQEPKQESELQIPIIQGVSEPENKTFEAGFFCIQSPVKSPSNINTPSRKNSLLKAVLSSEAKKSVSRSSASFAMLRASVMSKNVECEGITLMPQTPKNPINLYATPGRSILKPTNSTTKSAKKSIKVVLFDNPDDEIQELSPGMVEKEAHLDSGLSSMDMEKVEDKENSRRRSRLVRQDAQERSPVMTRSRKSIGHTVPTPRRSGSKVLQESEDNITEDIPVKRSSRRRKSAVQAVLD